MTDWQKFVSIISGVMTLLGLLTFIEKRVKDRHITDMELKTKQIEATHENTMQMKELSFQIREISNKTENHEGRIENLEDVVFPRNPIHFSKDRK